MPDLFDPDLLDQLEGLNERYKLLSKRIEELLDQAANYDQPLDTERLATFEALRHSVRQETETLLKTMLEHLADPVL